MSVNIVADSINLQGDRLITVEFDLHRFVLAEFNTHRVISRNFQSSRAIPLKRMRKLVSDNMAVPVYWGHNRQGMQASTELTGLRLFAAKSLWKLAFKTASVFHYAFEKLGVHKQITNRIIEPYMMTRGIATATLKGWESFFALRVHPEAQPEIRALATEIKEAIENSVPKLLKPLDWHIPYENLMDPSLNNHDKLIIAASAAAQVSYRTNNLSLEKAKAIYDKLRLDGVGGPAHASPAEHMAMATECLPNIRSNFDSHGPVHFIQYRKLIEWGKKPLDEDE